MKCEKCNQISPIEAKYCLNCGNLLVVENLEEVEVLETSDITNNTSSNDVAHNTLDFEPKPIPVQDNRVYSQPQPIMAPSNLFPNKNVPVYNTPNNFTKRSSFTRHKLKFNIKDITHNKLINLIIFIILLAGIGYLIYSYCFTSEVTCTKTDVLEETVYVAKFNILGLTYLSYKNTYDYSLYNYYDILEFQDFISSDIDTFTNEKEEDNLEVSYEIDGYNLSLMYETKEDEIKDTQLYSTYKTKDDFVEYMEQDGYTCE